MHLYIDGKVRGPGAGTAQPDVRGGQFAMGACCCRMPWHSLTTATSCSQILSPDRCLHRPNRGPGWKDCCKQTISMCHCPSPAPTDIYRVAHSTEEAYSSRYQFCVQPVCASDWSIGDAEGRDPGPSVALGKQQPS